MGGAEGGGWKWGPEDLSEESRPAEHPTFPDQTWSSPSMLKFPFPFSPRITGLNLPSSPKKVLSDCSSEHSIPPWGRNL